MILTGIKRRDREFSYVENYQHSSQIIHIRIPDIQHNFVEIKVRCGLVGWDGDLDDRIRE